VDEPLTAEVLHALAHPLRLAALVALEDRDQAPGELAAALGVDEPELLAHLDLLDATGLVEVEYGTGLIRARSSGWSAVAARLARLQQDARADGAG
jgi:DNA-binding transcriptional ArsR family regulator